MWRQVVLQFSLLFIVRCTLVMPTNNYGHSAQTSCIHYEAVNHNRICRMINEEWRSQDPVIRRIITKPLVTIPTEFAFNVQPMRRRMDHIFDNIIPGSNNLLKEHAKLVQDINSLRQMVFISPFVEENKDYDDSIFHEIIETSAATRPTQRPFISSTRSPVTSTKGSSIPIILLGGASQRQVVRSQPINFIKPTVSLVGTTASPLLKHPYPFVMNSQRKPVKVCMTALPSMYPTTKRPPTLWNRLLEYFTPLRSLGR